MMRETFGDNRNAYNNHNLIAIFKSKMNIFSVKFYIKRNLLIFNYYADILCASKFNRKNLVTPELQRVRRV